MEETIDSWWGWRVDECGERERVRGSLVQQPHPLRAAEDEESAHFLRASIASRSSNAQNLTEPKNALPWEDERRIAALRRQSVQATRPHPKQRRMTSLGAPSNRDVVATSRGGMGSQASPLERIEHHYVPIIRESGADARGSGEGRLRFWVPP